MTGTTRTDASTEFRTPAFLESLRQASARARGLTRLMVATDFSLRAELALARALRLPLVPAASLTLFHAAQAVVGQGAPGNTSLEGRCLHRMAETARRRLRARAPVDVREELRTGDAAEQATQVARALDIELVVAGRPQTARGWDVASRGATVRHLVRGAQSPLLVVGTHPLHAYQRPLVAVDLSEDSRRAVELALRLCPSPVGVDVLHVPAACMGRELWREGTTASTHWLRARQELEVAARAAVSRFLAPYREVGRVFAIGIRCGEPLEEAFLHEAAEQGTDLLALGASSGRRSSRGLAERMVMGASCDVLVAKAPGGASGTE